MCDVPESWKHPTKIEVEGRELMEWGADAHGETGDDLRSVRTLFDGGADAGERVHVVLPWLELWVWTFAVFVCVRSQLS